MKFCNANNCNTPVFSKGFCKSHQYLKENFDSRSIVQKAIYNKNQKSKISRLSDISIISEYDKTRSELIHDIDKQVSLFVRIRDADENGIVKCYTCQTIKHYTELQCGHFIKRGNMGLRFDAKNNCRTQCVSCNIFKEGNIKIYSINLDKEQEGLASRLEIQSREVYKHSITELELILREFKQKVIIIKNKLKIIS